MKLKSKLSKFASAFTAVVMCITMLPKVASLSSAANVGDKLSVGNGTNQHKGNCDGYSYEVWIDQTGGSGSMTLGQGAAFKAEWSANVSSGNFLARRGLDFGSQKKATDYSYIGLDYDAEYKQTGSANGNSRLCVYGWFQNKNAGNVPLVEYYIIEDWVDWCPDANGKMVTIDGAQYKIFQMDHTGPTINGGSETFKQYFSVRQNKRTSGHITVSDHFKAWADQGWGIGNLYEVALNAEGWQSSGYADIKKLDVYTKDPGVVNPNPGPDPQPTVQPDKDGNYFYDTFESGAGNWEGRGDASVKTDSSNYVAGSKSLAVTGRTDYWHGAAINLDSDAFVAGGTYSFSTGVLQRSGSAVEMKMTLQYSLNGEENYDEVASVTAKSDEWTKLENTAYTIPSGASNLVLYVEAPESLTDFYIDEAKGSKEGVKSSVTIGGGTVQSGTTINGNSSTTTTTTTTTNNIPELDVTVDGDVNCDNEVNLADAVLIMQNLANPSKYKITDQGRANGDVDQRGDGITSSDAFVIQKYVLGIINKLPESYSSTQPQNTTTTTTTTSAVIPTVKLDSKFSDGTDDWESRGAATLALDKESYYSAGSSLKVSGREDNWQGAAISLPSDFKAGGTYSFSAGVMQASGSSQAVKMTLQYDLNGETNYDMVAEADAADKTWTKLENTAYTIPDGATDLLLYVELPDSLADYYLDDVVAANEGTKSSVVTGQGTVGEIAVPGPVINPGAKLCAISFDDGESANSKSDPAYRIMDALIKNNMSATFFYVGDWIKSGDQVKYAYQNGMEVANHSTSHPQLGSLGAQQVRSQWEQCNSKLKSIIGAEPSHLMRLPYLDGGGSVKSALNDVPLISCAIDTQDWNGASKDQIVNTIKQAAQNGSLEGAIVLCHENYAATAAAMEEVLPWLAQNGYQNVSISEMAEAHGKTLAGGQIHTRA